MGWFYDKQIALMAESGGYMHHGSWINGELAKVKTISCDVQPASREQIYKDYGYYIECTQRIFCDTDDDLIIGSLIEYDGALYKIVKIVKWDDYMDVFAENTEVSGNE